MWSSHGAPLKASGGIWSAEARHSAPDLLVSTVPQPQGEGVLTREDIQSGTAFRSRSEGCFEGEMAGFMLKTSSFQQ